MMLSKYANFHQIFKYMKKFFTLDNFSSFIFYFSILIFIIGFGFLDAPTPFGWYQQFMPTQTYGQIRDIFFVDSLVGFAVSDSTIFKTTNSGDNWAIKLNPDLYIFEKIQFLNKDTGFVCAGNNKLFKTVNAGENWTYIIPDLLIYPFDMWVLSTDTILFVSSGGGGGVFRTTNGGFNWNYQAGFGANNPDHIYMYNSRIGFIGKANNGIYASLYKTKNGGNSWVHLTDSSFTDMYFVDSLTGWMASGRMKKTTDGGLTWQSQDLPHGGNLEGSTIQKFSIVNRDTIWGVGNSLGFPNNQYRGVIYKTTNGGSNWGFQLPDTSINIGIYYLIKVVNRLNIWAQGPIFGTGYPSEVHTVTGGNDTTFTFMKKTNSNIPKIFLLYQNYPNPFNSITKIRYQIAKSKEQISTVKISIFDITGKRIIDLVNQRQDTGTFEVDFSGDGLSSGVYFYSLIVDGYLIDTKKMLIIK